ncbi:MAG: fumarylacetoacetate hydrolase family protein [Alphaproteobacteria bacterium]|nr:fumarylacetoacetate hydrolase family protein [Alphaproteobacteria bacterium]
MKIENVQQAARRLVEAWQDGSQIGPLPESCRPRTLAEAYRVQDAIAKSLGAEVGGWKVGATGMGARKLLKARGPFAGRIFAGRIFESGVAIPSDAYPLRGLEGEIAFKLAKDLPGRAKPYRLAEVKKAIGSVHPAIEIVAPRWTDWLAVGLPSLVADHGANAALVLGKPFAKGTELDLDGMAVEMRVDGATIGKGTGADVLGGPHASLLWLANALRRRGGLKAGQIVSTGTCTGLFKAPPKAKVAALYGGKPRVELRFV